MITISNVSVGGIDSAIKAMRNPLNSWEKSDSYHREGNDFIVGDADLQLAKNLVKAGTDHSKFMRMITVWADINAPLYFWAELDTYKIGTVRNSCSKMHTIHKRDLTLCDFSTEHLKPQALQQLHELIDTINSYRQNFVEKHDKDDWWQMIQLLPNSFNQKATMMFNYQTLRGLYKVRKDHKLDEWHTFCDWVKTLPYSELITTDFSKE